MSFCHPYCAFGVPADAITVVGYPISGILAIACLPSAVDVFLKTFWRIFAEHMSCWHTYCAVGVPADPITVVG
jgi:hypothetical protein